MIPDSEITRASLTDKPCDRQGSGSASLASRPITSNPAVHPSPSSARDRGPLPTVHLRLSRYGSTKRLRLGLPQGTFESKELTGRMVTGREVQWFSTGDWPGSPLWARPRRVL